VSKVGRRMLSGRGMAETPLAPGWGRRADLAEVSQVQMSILRR
jgi:hypothetical protein